MLLSISNNLEAMTVTPQEARDNFGCNLDRLLTARGLSTNAAARMCGMDSGNMHRLRAGQRQPSVSQASMVASALGVSIESLLIKPPAKILRAYREHYPALENERPRVAAAS